MHEDGIGMARTFELELTGAVATPTGPQSGFFANVDGAPASGYRAHKAPLHIRRRPTTSARPTILTGEYGARVLTPLVADRAEVLAVDNRFFGGNVGVAGLLVAEDLSRVLEDQPVGGRYLLPDVCLSGGRFLDGGTVDDQPRAVEVVATDGIALRAALET
jgi:hypothetical protein